MNYKVIYINPIIAVLSQLLVLFATVHLVGIVVFTSSCVSGKQTGGERCRGSHTFITPNSVQGQLQETPCLLCNLHALIILNVDVIQVGSEIKIT